MRNSDTPYLADLLAISLRWLVLFGLVISLGTGGALILANHAIRFPIIILVLGMPALWNGFVSALSIFNRRLIWHRQINVILDVLFATALFITTGGLGGDIPWVVLLPLFSGAIYYEIRGALIVAVMMSVLQAGYTFLMMGSAFQWIPVVVWGGINLSSFLVWLLSAPLIRRLRTSYLSTVTQRRESERKAQRQERDRMRALFEMIETFSSTLNYQTVLNTVLETAFAALSDRNGSAEDMVGAVLLFGDNQELEIRAERRFMQRDTTISLPADQGVLYDALKSGETRLVQDPANDPELSKLLTLQERKAAFCLPLIRGMNAFGVMLFAHTDPDFFTQERIETLQMLGNQAVISLQNARLYQDLAHEKERIVQTQEEAQKKLARDLHDGPTQSVSAIAMRINIARKILERSPKEADAELVKIEELARRTTQEIRHMLFTLRPLVLETEGLLAALNTMAEKMHELYQQKIIIDADPDVIMQLDASHQTVVFYLAEEATNNARKHAEATEIWVRLKCVPKAEDIAVLEIADNGVGFDVKSVMDSYDRRGSLGMINLRERADLVNGLLKIDSAPGKGTRIRVFIPLTDQAADRLHHR